MIYIVSLVNFIFLSELKEESKFKKKEVLKEEGQFKYYNTYNDHYIVYKSIFE